MRSNLLSLQNIAGQVDLTQNRLSTGLKVNSAIDNPSSYYTAVSLNNRASDLSSLLDSMAQGIQTIKAATEGLQAGAALLEQAAAVASQALNGSSSVSKPIDYYLEQGYTAINSTMNSAEIEALMVDGARLVLADDVVLDAGLEIAANNVTIDGNGHCLSYGGTDDLLSVSGSNATVTNVKLDYINASGGSAIEVTGSADISLIEIEAQGNKVYGIHCDKDGKISLDNTFGIKVSGQGAHNLVNGNAEIYDGRSNTQAIVGQIGANASAAWATHQFYAPGVVKDDATFGQGQWYLPSIGELMELYGTDADAMTAGDKYSGAIGDNKDKINDVLEKLKTHGIDTQILQNASYWSSSECMPSRSWKFSMTEGARHLSDKYADNAFVRCFSFLENRFDPSVNTPKIGDMMYSDMSYGSVDDYNGDKTAVGVVVWTSEDGRSAKIIGLQDLCFSSREEIESFNPDKPYSGAVQAPHWTLEADKSTDISDITNMLAADLLKAAQSGGEVAVGNTGLTPERKTYVASRTQISSYNELLSQYESLIKDSSYKGINLLQEQELTVTFNEDRSARLAIRGKDLTLKALGLNAADWLIVEDVARSLAEISAALGQIRQASGQFGNYYSIVTTRENFTQNLINVLTEGADKLTLADMNEESANMLALQTRQQLAVNSLSLASQASQSILKLF